MADGRVSKQVPAASCRSSDDRKVGRRAKVCLVVQIQELAVEKWRRSFHSVTCRMESMSRILQRLGSRVPQIQEYKIAHARSLERTGNNLRYDTTGQCCQERFQAHALGGACSLDTLSLGKSSQFGGRMISIVVLPRRKDVHFIFEHEEKM